MADIRLMRSKVDVKIKLWPQDLRDIVIQPEIVAALTDEELKQINTAINGELNSRENGEKDE